MGKAARWLKAFFGIKTSANNQSHKHSSNSSGVDGERTRSSFGRDRMLGCYGGGICNNPETIPPNISPSEAEWIKYNYYNNNNNSAAGAHNNNKRSSGEYYSTSSSSTEKEKEKEKAAMEENKHAIAVAAATAAAADAAVAAAQAAAAVVRLTSHGRCSTTTNRFTTSHKYYWDAAAVKIQTTFRGYLARKALRALRALVKLQALVRGYLVRKQATAKFHGMQALIRAQSTIRSKRLLPHMMTTNNSSTNPSNIQRQKDYYFPPTATSSRPSRRSMDIYDDTRSSTLSMPNSSSSRRLSLSAASFDTKNIINPLPIPDSEYYDIPPKVVQIDPGRPKSGSRRSTTTSYSELGEDPSSYQSLYYPPPRLSIPTTCHHCSHQQDDDDDDHYIRPFSATAQTTPRFIYPPATPSRTNSVCGDNNDNNHFGPYYYYPNYMASTKSFKAKSRSQSVPKQRPADILSTKKRLSAVDYELDSSSTNSIGLYGVRMQRSSSHATTTNNNRGVSLNFNNNAVSYR